MTTAPTPSHGYQATPRVSPGRPVRADVTTTPTPSGPTLPGDDVDAARELADALVEALGVESATRIAKALEARVGDLHERVEALLQRSEALLQRAEHGCMGLGDPRQALDRPLQGVDVLGDHLAWVDVSGHDADVRPALGSPSDDPAETPCVLGLGPNLEDFIRVDEILARALPEAVSADRIRAAVEIVGALKWGAL